MKTKVSHFYREPLKVIPKYITNYDSEFFNKRWVNEDELQPEIIRMLYAMVEPEECLEICAIPGGSARTSIGVAMKLKIMGVRAGVPDLMLLWKGGIAFIEVKGMASLSVAQKEFKEYAEKIEIKRATCKTLNEALCFAIDCGLKVRRLT